MRIKVTEPTNACLTVARVKDFLRIDDADSDTLIGELLPVATRDVMGYTKRSIASRTVTLYLDLSEIKGGKVKLPHGPVQSITGVTNYDAEGDISVISSDNYELAEGDWLVGKNAGFTYMVGREDQAVAVVYVAGYTDDPTSVGAADDAYAVAQLQHAIRLRLADLMEQRTSEEAGTVVAESKNTTWKKICDPFKQLPLV